MSVFIILYCGSQWSPFIEESHCKKINIFFKICYDNIFFFVKST